MLQVNFDALSLKVSENLTKREPVFLIEFPHIFALSCLLNIDFF